MIKATGYTKYGDTEMIWAVNMNLSASTVKAFVRKEGTVDERPAYVFDALTGKVAIDTSDLDVGQYDLEVEVTQNGKIATFPDQGYAKLVVVQDLG